MKKWNFAGILAAFLLLGSLVLLGSFFFNELSSMDIPNPTDSTTTVATTTEETTQETTTVETTTEETTQETTTEATQKETTGNTQGSSSAGYSVSAGYAFVYDMESGAYTYQKGDAQRQIAPASITKLFTAYVALRYLKPDAVLTAGSEVGMIVSGSSNAGLQEGNQLTVEMCVEAMMLASGNDAAYILAVAAGRAIGGDELSIEDAMSVFMDAVNQDAQHLGMTNTHFVTPDGIDRTGHYTCAQDLLIIARLALQNPILAQYANTQFSTVVLESGQTCTWINSNLLLDRSSKYYHPDAIGLKTGTTSKAGACLLAAFRGENGTVIVGVFGCSTNETRYEDALYLYRTYG